MLTIWKDINGWEEYYEVSEAGDIRNKITGHILIGDTNTAGYKRVCLYNKNHNPAKQRFFRHRLVAQHFIPNPRCLPEVNHIDSNLTHNYKENLEWVDKKENELHSRKFGAKEYKPFEAVFSNGVKVAYDAMSDLAKILGVSNATVRMWLHKKNKGFEKHGIVSIKYI